VSLTLNLSSKEKRSEEFVLGRNDETFSQAQGIIVDRVNFLGRGLQAANYNSYGKSHH
jgi:hypothetical protein